ncbi:type II toxin-antitoxin system HicB family antitoxin [Nodularia sp. UHCC 0506]|uniref:type II toxin-antitoxin system HicB family antitoxin n=1 Tax=Nodularia sp. UHCC 0506 TaxID=3110243 RepID=UPI002B2176B9|nr:type II toxin-antitoxin system HicB family antitoxin [Nodularia sp. UHCC 0506]MEA5512771.1 type II toxin-antitoxin system HicB family antitoxin [Nodularia sp. UHCC 0506]
MVKEFSVIIERDSDGYFVASVPNLKGCHTQAKSLNELMERIQEAIELCLEFENSAIGKSRFRQMEVYDSHQ